MSAGLRSRNRTGTRFNLKVDKKGIVAMAHGNEGERIYLKTERRECPCPSFSERTIYEKPWEMT